LIAFGNMVRFIYAGLDLFKAEPVFQCRRNAARERRRAEQRSGGDNAKAAADDVAAAVAPLDDVSNESRSDGLKGTSSCASKASALLQKRSVFDTREIVTNVALD